VTHQEHTPDQQSAPRSDQEDTVPAPDGAVSPESAADELDKTLELPVVQGDSQQTAVVQPAISAPGPLTAVTETTPEPQTTPAETAPEAPVPTTENAAPVGASTVTIAEPEQLQITAVMPQVPPVPAEVEAAPPAPDSVLPSADLVPPPADQDQAPDDTSDFTLSDITLTDAGGGGLRGWLHGLKSRFGFAAEPEPIATAAPVGKAKRWGLHPWQWTLVGVGAVFLIAALLVGVDAGLYYNKVHHGVEVADQNLGGMTSSEATQTLTAFAEEAKKRPITLKSDSGDQTWDILPSDLGTTIDVPAAVSKAMTLTRKADVFTDLATKIGLYFRGYNVPLEGTIDSAKMDALLAKITTALDVPATNATLLVNNGAVEVVEGKQGTVVDKETLRAALTKLLLTFHSTELLIPMVTTAPDLSAVDITPALAQANVMVGADLVLTFKGQTVATLRPSEIVNYLAVAPSGGSGNTETIPILSAEKMATLFDTVEKKVNTPGVNAGFDMDLEAEPHTLKLVAGSDGQGLDREATAAALSQAAMNTAGRTVDVVLKPIPPDLTTEEVQAMGIKDLLGDYKTSPYVGTKNRQINVRLATKLCSGVFLAPGEEFNTDLRLGVRDAAHGWASAPGIVGPGQLEDVPGGGICQVSTTLFNAVLEAGLEITKRFNHSIYINHYPNGRDATVTAGGKNMCFRNDTANYVFIYGWSTGINTHFWIWGVADGRKVLPIEFSGFSKGGSIPTQTVINKSLPLGSKKTTFDGQVARSCSITRTVIYADGTKKSQTWSSHWTLLPKVIETNPTTGTTTKPPTTGTTTKPTTTTGESTTTTAPSSPPPTGGT
jgi:vancomycin resistance protein YoaR